MLLVLSALLTVGLAYTRGVRRGRQQERFAAAASAASAARGATSMADILAQVRSPIVTTCSCARGLNGIDNSNYYDLIDEVR